MISSSNARDDRTARERLALSHLALLPTLNCPAQCTYCFGPHQDSPIVDWGTLEAIRRWVERIEAGRELEITFHGGEPLLAGRRFYETVLPFLRKSLAPRRVRFAIQSNLWSLDDALCELFRQYRVSLGTSLDGPEEINDAQRGAGYFRRTMAGIQRARRHGLRVGVICTFTRRSAACADEVFNFFLAQGLEFGLHMALPALGREGDDGWSLSPADAETLFLHLLDRYLEHLERIRISTFDSMCRSLSAGQGGLCIFTDCLGKYLAVDPEGWIYACQRLAGHPAWRLGNVHDRPSWEDLGRSPAWQALAERQEHISRVCDGCPHLAICRGGCPYNALTAGGGRFDGDPRDPYCPAYRRVFDYIGERALQEVFSEANLRVVVERGPGRYGLLQRGRLLRLMRDDLHPQKAAAQARRTVAAAALGMSASAEEAVDRLDRLGIVTDRTVALGSVRALEHDLRVPTERLLNAYLHITYACNLACDHCYARAAPSRRETMTVEDILRLGEAAAACGFAKIVITGGEPLVHPQRNALLDGLAALRRHIRATQIVLRTNLTLSLDDALLDRLRCAADQIVVSLDGDEAIHDARRGAGTYARTLANLHRLCAEPGAEVVLTAVLPPEQMAGPPGEAVRRVAEGLGLSLRFKPLLPLGRAAELGLKPPRFNPPIDSTGLASCIARPSATCGLGMNLYVAPDGACFPCYALTSHRHALGNALVEGLAKVLARNDAYRRVTVDSNRRCRLCPLRYLCGGLCRAWGVDDDPDAPPTGCWTWHERARNLLRSALEALGVGAGHWLAAGLLLPEAPPEI